MGDYPHLRDQMDQVKHNTGKKPKEVTVDAEYSSGDDIQNLEGLGITALIPPDKIKHSKWRDQKPPRGRMPKNMDLSYRRRRSLRTRRGRERYELRQTLVELRFGHFKKPLGLRQFLLRSLGQVRCSYWRFARALHNILKLFTAGVGSVSALAKP